MLIIGAKGFAKEVLEIYHNRGEIANIAFYDDVSTNIQSNLYNKFQILTSLNEVKSYFNKTDNTFVIGIGNPKLRKVLLDKFTAIGGHVVSSISKKATIGNYDVNIGKGSNILATAILSNSVTIGLCCIVYYGVIITHDCVIGNFVEISPGAKILGRVTIGSFVQIGAGAIILPDLVIGNNVIIGAGSVITKDVSENSVIFGVPGKIIKKNNG